MLHPHRPFTRAEARAAGLSDHRLSGPEFRRVLGGVYIGARVPDHPLVRARAAVLVHPPSAVASHTTAARVVGAPVPLDPLEHVTVPAAADRRQRLGLRCHVAALGEADVRVVSGLRLTSPGRMFLELAAQLPLVDLVVVGDWLVGNGHITVAALRRACQDSGERGAGAARRGAAYVRERVDSPMETRLRMLLVLAGLPEPVVNLSLRDGHGQVVMRLDLSYPEVRVAVEYDGRQHAEREAQWERDLERREGLDLDQWQLLVVTSKGIYREPGRTVERVWRTLRARGYRPLPARPGDAWRPHFTGR